MTSMLHNCLISTITFTKASWASSVNCIIESQGDSSELLHHNYLAASSSQGKPNGSFANQVPQVMGWQG